MPLNLMPMIRQLSVIDNRKESPTFGMIVPFPIEPDSSPGGDFGWAQRRLVAEIERQYNLGLPVRIVVLKARQLGISTVSEAVMFLWAMLTDHMQGLVLAHENDTTQSLFEKTQTFWDTWPLRSLYTARHATQRRLVWSNGSSIRTATAGNRNAGVGRTLRALHTSEAAKYPEPEKLMGGLRQGLPEAHGTIEIVESTAEGIGGWFYDEWTRAVEGESNYVPLFFPWFHHYEYRVPPARCPIKAESDLIDDEERRLYRLGACFEALQWRREVIPSKLNYDEQLFLQEFPATPEEAFLTSGRNVFNLSQLLACYDSDAPRAQGDLHSPDGTRPEWLPAPDGKLAVFKAPSRRPDKKLYFVAVDPTRTTYGDPACIQVINRATHEQVAVWHGQPTDPLHNANEIAREVIKIGRWYHDAEVLVEVGGGGAGVIAALIERGYPNLWRHRQADRPKTERAVPVYGFLSNHDRKSWAVECFKYLIAKNVVRIHDEKTFHQLQNFTHLSEWEMGNADPSDHDDAADAFILACYGDQTETAYVPEQYRSPFESDLEVFTQHGA